MGCGPKAASDMEDREEVWRDSLNAEDLEAYQLMMNQAKYLALDCRIAKDAYECNLNSLVESSYALRLASREQRLTPVYLEDKKQLQTILAKSVEDYVRCRNINLDNTKKLEGLMRRTNHPLFRSN